MNRRFLLLLLLAGCTGSAPPSGHDRVEVRVVYDEADAAEAILQKRVAGSPPDSADWARLFASEGYQRLKEREHAMGRVAFTDSAFRAFLLSDTLLQRADTLLRTLAAWRRVDLTASAGRILPFLPPGTRIRANLYPEIKPATNSFVHRRDSTAGIFLYIDPEMSPEELATTAAHELHHIGFADGCPYEPDTAIALPLRTMHRRLYGFSEGLAMFAAGGGSGHHPQASSRPGRRAAWDSSVANIADGFRDIERFMRDVIEGRMTSEDSIVRAGFAFYGEQGPWYTVGWYMADAIERASGRERLLEVMCSPRALMEAYNMVAGPGSPRWPADLVARLPM